MRVLQKNILPVKSACVATSANDCANVTAGEDLEAALNHRAAL